MKKIITLVSIFIFLFNIGSAQWTSNTALNTVVSDSIGSSEVTPLMVTIADGSTYVSWFQSNPTTFYELRMQRLDKNGNKLWGSNGLLVSNHPQNSALYRYDLKADNEGNALVAFQDERSGHLDIVIYKIDSSGNMVWGNNGIELSDGDATQGLAPTIGVTNDNNVIVAWNSTNSNGKWVSYQKIFANGAAQWLAPKQIKDATNVIRYSRPTMVPAGADDFVMLYAEETGGFPPTSKMYAQHFDASGVGVWTNPVLVSTKTFAFFYFPVAVSDLNGGFYVGFSTSLTSNPTLGDVYVQHVDSAGNLWSAAGSIASTSTTNQKFAAGTLLDPAANEIYVLLKMTDLSQNNSGVSIQKFDTSGNALLAASASTVVPVAVAYHDPNGFSLTPTGLIIAYTTGSFSSQVMNARKIDFNGNALWGGNAVSLCSTNAAKDDAGMGIFSNNQAVIIWTDSRIDNGIYAQNITDDGITGIVSVNENSNNTKVQLYPNPSHDLNLIIDAPGVQEIIVTDINRRTVNAKNLSNLRAGTYLVKVIIDDNVYLLKWMKM